MSLTRRKFVVSASTLAFGGLLRGLTDKAFAAGFESITGYGSLMPDPDNIFDLPEGFSYKIISAQGDKMDDGYLVPDMADGMGCFPLEGSHVALIRNHEISYGSRDKPMSTMQKPLMPFAYDHSDENEPLPGGTTTIIYDTATGKRVKEYLSLLGTLTNCAGGTTPWGSWLSCEENVARAGEGGQKDHGWVFEVPVKQDKLTNILPLKEMGRFNHEAAAVDPKTGIVYLTEDRPNSLFYRFIPNQYGELSKGGKLQALAIQGQTAGFDTRNWDGINFKQGSWLQVSWIDLDEIDSPNDDLRVRGHNNGAAIFARGEGIFWGDNELYFCCTSGGEKNIGQIMRYKPSIKEGTAEENADGVVSSELQLFFESEDKSTFSFGDNLTVAPNGHLLICEDNYDDTSDYIRGITPEGGLYTFAKLNIESEPAGVCFSPDGGTLFVNIQSPTKTLAITGPWDKFSS
ncbi:MAG: DUF839 domain-containing protein [Kordiimonadaceae bacterium]|jgi:uncharacterized protein|nr:DUF839 domain-containing protein [Kordiimonadaceae bacterium]MBT6033925.1 DUF839 domain-containing protein [Kordiimonadaceae bacterium]